MKNKLIAALIIAMLLSIAVGNTALAIKLNCSTCGQWQDATFLGYGYWDNRFHCEKYLCHVCNVVTEWGQTRHETSIAATCTEQAYCDICKSYFGKTKPHTWKTVTADDTKHTVICSDCSKTETAAHESDATCTTEGTCNTCKKSYKNPNNHTGPFTYAYTKSDESFHMGTEICTGCGKPTGKTSSEKHTETKKATCQNAAYCRVCEEYYGKPNAENHVGEPSTAYVKTSETQHTEKITYSGCRHTLDGASTDHTETTAATCTSAAYCGVCRSSYGKPDTKAHDLESHEARAATCTEIGWNAYDTCKRCDYTTYAELPALEHDIVKHDAKAPTCTEIGWNAYDTCRRCDYTTYAELPALEHDIVKHDAKAPTCTEIGWNAYDTCRRCDYTTYAELPALEHDYQKTIVKPTCVKGGYTLCTCARCADTYTENPVKKLLHWYGEWSPNGDDTHSAACRRKGCRHTGKTECETFEYRLLFADAEAYAFELCPVCGEVSDGARLALVTEAKAKAGRLPKGELVLRLSELQNSERVLSIGFEYSGKLTLPTGPVEIYLPAALLEGHALHILAADGTETELPFTVTEKTAAFTLTFDAQDEIPVRTLHLVPVQ